jgi:hypothetical protein
MTCARWGRGCGASLGRCRCWVRRREAGLCRMAELAKPLVEGGYPLQRVLCRRPDGSRCNQYSRCPARSGRDGPKDAAIVVGTHALVGSLVEWVADGGLLVVDEPPCLVESERVSLADLRRAKAALSLFEADYAKAMTPVLESAISIAEDGGPPTDLLRHPSLGAFPGAAKGPPVRTECLVTAAASLSWARELGRVTSTLRALEHFCAGGVKHASVRVVGGRRSRTLRLAYPRGTLCDAFSNANVSVVIMDAGADVHVPVLKRLMGEEPRLHRFFARDGSLVHRTLLSTRGATRRQWVVKHNAAPTEQALAAIERTLGWASESPETRALGVITFQPLAAAMKRALETDNQSPAPRGEHDDRSTPTARLASSLRRWPGRIQIAHYGAVRGLDSMKDVDALITLGDPWPNLGEVQHEVESLCLSESWERRAHAHCQVELEQAHGRVRAAHRSRPARVAHLGSVLPGGSGWLHDVEFRHDRKVRAGVDSRCDASEVEEAVRAIGGLRATARQVGCSHVTLHRYLRGRAVPATIGARLRALAGATSAPSAVVPAVLS